MDNVAVMWTTAPSLVVSSVWDSSKQTSIKHYNNDRHVGFTGQRDNVPILKRRINII